MAGTTCVRWSRYGHDRLYVSAGDGRRLGWHDLRSGRTHLEHPDAASDVSAAVAHFLRSGSPLRTRRVAALVGVQRRPSPLERIPGAHAWEVDEPRAAHADLSRRLPAELATRELVRLVRAQPAARGRWARLRGRSPLGPRTRRWHTTVLGEREVGALLSRLAPAWHVLHSLPVPAGAGARDVDHLLVGPGGVLVVQTASYPGGRVRVDGRRLRVGRSPAGHVPTLQRLIGEVTRAMVDATGEHVAVRGLLVVHGARSVEVRDPVPGLTVLADRDVEEWLRGRPTTTSSVDVARLAAVAARASTWPAGDHEPDDGLDEEGRDRRRVEEARAFDALHTEVRAAERTRRRWRAGLVVLGGLTALTALALLTGLLWLPWLT
jgi:hypothetical protein